jgi:ParB family chromosome partitioning protein
MACEIKLISVTAIRPNPNQPRKVFAVSAIRRLADTIREHGILQPILVRKVAGIRGYELVAGERRLRAARMLGWKSIPAVAVSTTEQRSAEMAIIENVMREGLSPLEEGRALKALLDGGESYRGLARRIGKTAGYIQNRVRLLSLQADIRALVRRRPHLITHAYELSRIEDAGMRRALVQKCLGDKDGSITLTRLRYEMRFAKQKKRQSAAAPYALWECEYSRDPSDGSEKYPGACHPSVVQRCLECISGNTLRRRRPPFVLWIPFAGSGTGITTATKMGVKKVIATDVNPAAMGIQKVDARQSGLPTGSVDCIFAHPPYWRAFKYSRAQRGEKNRADISLAPTLDAYLSAMDEFFREAHRVLRPDGYLFVLIGDIRKANRLVPLVAHLSLLGEKFFNLTQRVTVLRNRSSPLTPLLVSNARRRGHLIDVTDTVLFFRKPL